MALAEGSQCLDRPTESASASVHELRELLDASAEGLLLIEAGSGRIIDANLAACRITGLDRNRSAWASFQQLLAHDGSQSQELRERVAEALRMGQVEFEWCSSVSFAATRHLAVTLVRCADGERMFVSLRDVTELRAAKAEIAAAEQRYLRLEQAAQRSQARFARIFQVSPDAMGVGRKRDGMLLEVNPGFEALFGWARAELIGKTTIELGIWPDPALRDTFIARLDAGVPLKDVTLPLQRKDGSLFDARLAVRPIEFDGQDALLFITRDVSTQRKAQNALESSEARFRGLSEATFDGIGVVEDGRILDVNDQLASMFGQTRSALIGTLVSTLVAPESQQEVRERMLHGNHEPYEHLAVHADGHVFQVEVRPRTLRFGDRELRIAAIRDVTERKQKEVERERLISELEARNTEMEQFTYTVSHDLKSPLVTINGFLGAVERDLANGDLSRAGVDLARIRSAASKMARLLDGLVNLSRVGHVVNTPQRMALRDIVSEAVELVAGAAQARGVAISVAADLPSIDGDRMRLVQVVQNLLENAIKYLGEQPAPQIEVGAEADSDAVSCWVRDNGIGIEPAYAERVFGLFEKLNPCSEGAGVGLALVRRIVEYHGGKVWVESDGKQGSRFVFRVPVSQALGREGQV
jgi:two-component system sensor kinase FixL